MSPPPTPAKVSAASRLLAERKNRGLSQRAMAAAIGVPRGVLGRAEVGASEPRGVHALAIARYLGCEVTDLWPVELELDQERAA